MHEDDDGEREEELGNGGPLGEESYHHARDVVRSVVGEYPVRPCAQDQQVRFRRQQEVKVLPL